MNTVKDFLELLSSISITLELSTGNEIKEACEIITLADEMTSGEIETLRVACLLGPLFDGDVPSKSDRDRLVASGCIEKVLMQGEPGYNACTIKGDRVVKVLDTMMEHEALRQPISVPEEKDDAVEKQIKSGIRPSTNSEMRGFLANTPGIETCWKRQNHWRINREIDEAHDPRDLLWRRIAPDGATGPENEFMEKCNGL